MKRTIILSLLATALSFSGIAQSKYPCGFDIVHQGKLSSDSRYKDAVKSLDERWIKYATIMSSAGLTYTSAGYVYEIPMVIHVLHTGDTVGSKYNPDSTKIAQMVDYLNKSYAATSPFPDTTAGGCRIPLKFVLAKRTPTGASTNGIIRLDASSISGYTTYGVNAATSTGVPAETIMAFSRWNPADYYNVYCVNKIDGNDLYTTGGIAGFAYFPGTPTYDGMIVAASQVRSGSTTVSHEFGHGFGLYHTFEGDAGGTSCPSTTSCTTTGDLVCDTEPHIRESSAFPSTWCPPTDVNSCTGGSYNNTQYNIMDYTNCPPNRYTAGQRTRVMNTLDNERTGFKTSFGLVTPTGAVASACTPTTSTSGTYNIGPYIVEFNGLKVWTGDWYQEDKIYVDHAYTQQSYVTKGSTYSISVSTRVNQQNVKVFIDYNNDGDFADTGEEVFSHNGTAVTETHSGSFTIPSTATTCTYLRMRVVAMYYGTTTTDYACGPYDYGQAEDYAVYVRSSPPTVTTPVTYCASATAAPLTATGTNLKWYTTDTGGTGSTTAPTPSTASAGTTTYYVSQSGDASSTCESSRSAITVTITAAPSAPTASSTVSYCVGATASALAATGTSLKWYTVASGGSGSTTAPVPSTSSAGSTTYYVSQTVGGCESPRATITVTVNAIPAAPTVTSPVTYCVGATAAPLVATGTGLLWYTTATGGTGSATLTPSTATPGATTYYVSQTVSGCESPRASIVVNISGPLSAPTVTTPVNYCEGATAVALTTTGTNLRWYTAASGGTPSSTAPTPLTTPAGTTTYYVSQSADAGGSCESSRSGIVVNINALPSAPTVSNPVNKCQGDAATALTATKATASDTLYWYTAATGGTGSITAPSTTTTTGMTTYYVSERSTMGCESIRTPLTVYVNPPVLPFNIGSPDSILCIGESTQLYHGPIATSDSFTTSSTTTGRTASRAHYFDITAKKGVTINGFDVNISTTTSTPVSIYYKTGTYAGFETNAAAWTLLGTGNVSTAAFIETVPLPVSINVTIPAGEKAAFCIVHEVSGKYLIHHYTPATNDDANISISTLNTTSGYFSSISSTGVYPNEMKVHYGNYSKVWNTGSMADTINVTTPPSTINYWMRITNSIGCTRTDTIPVQVNPLPAAPTVSTVNLCLGSTASALTATKPTSTDTLYWYTTPSGGTGSTTAPIPATASVGTTTYYVSAKSVWGCEGPRAALNVTVNGLPSSPTVTSPVTYCQGATASALSATLASAADTLYWYTVPAGGAGTKTTPTPSTTAAMYTKYYVSERNSMGCESPRTPLTVRINPKPVSVTATALSATNFCAGDSVTLVASASVASIASPNIYKSPKNASTAFSNCNCPTGYVAVGYEGRAAAWMDQFNLICKPINRFGVFGGTAVTTTTNGVSTGGAYYGPYTFATDYLVGMNVRIDTVSNQINDIAGYGQAHSYIAGFGNNTSSASSLTRLIGWDAGELDMGIEWAPDGTVISGMQKLPSTYSSGVIFNYTPIGAYQYSYSWSTSDTTDSIKVKTSGSYTLTVTNSYGCSATSSPVAVTVNPIPGAPTVTSPVIFCQNSIASALTATKALSTDTLYWYTSASGGTGSKTAPVPSTTTVGSTTYYVSARGLGACEGNRTPIVVQINPSPVAPTVSTPVAYCQSATASVLTATKPSATDTLYWYTVATGGTGSTTAPTPSTATAGSSTFYVSAKNTFVCEGPRAAITVNVNPTPTAPVVVSPVNYCQGAPSSPLSATKLATTDTLLWYSTPTGGTPSMLVITPSTTTPGTTNYYVSLKTMFGCEGPRATITVTVNPTPAAPTATSPVVYCQGATATALTATKATSSDTLYWYTVPTGGTGSSTAPTPATAATGSTPYYVSAKSSASCEGNRTTVVVTVNPTPAAPSVTASVVYCLNTTAVPLTATKASTTDTLYWYTVATGGTGSITAPTPSTATAGTTNYYVSAKNTSKCEGPRALITVTVNALPAAPTVTSPVNLCIGGPAAALTATGTSIKWYTSPTGGVGSSTAPTPSTAAAGTTNYYVTQTNAGTGCESPRATIAVIVNNLPAAPTVTTPVIYCQNAPATALTATKATSTDTLYWYTVASGGSGSITAPVPSTTTVGSTNYYVSSRSVYGCEGNRAAITVTVNPTPVAPTVTTPVIYCQNVTASPLSATGTDTLKWYTVATGGTASLTPPTPSTATAGTTLRYVSQRNSYGCESPRATITITINAAPANPTVTSPLNLCVGGPSSPLTATGTALKWYTTATGGTGSSTAPTPSTATTGTTVYYVTQTESVNFCESNRASISVVVNPLPAAPAVTSPLNLCIGSVPSALTATGTSLKWYTVATGGSGSSTAPVPSTAAIGSTNYYVSQTSSVGCEGPRALITVAIQPLPVVTVAPVGVPDFFFCFGKTLTVKATSLTAISYQWFSGTTPISGATADTFNTGTTGFYKVVATSVYGCKGEKEVFIQQDTTALPVLAPTDAMICEEGSVLLYCHPAYTGFIFDWIKDGISMSPPMPKANAIPVNMAGTYKVTVTNLYGCINTTNTATVGIYPKPIKPVIVRTDPTLALSPSSYIHYQWYKDGKKIFAATADKYIFSENGKYHAEITDANGCINQSDTIIISNVSVGNVTRDANIKVYPNPTNDILYIEAPFGIKVQVFDLLGKKLIEEQYQDQLRLGNLPDGNYFIKLFDLNNAFITNHKINKITQ